MLGKIWRFAALEITEASEDSRRFPVLPPQPSEPVSYCLQFTRSISRRSFIASFDFSPDRYVLQFSAVRESVGSALKATRTVWYEAKQRL